MTTPVEAGVVAAAAVLEAVVVAALDVLDEAAADELVDALDVLA